MPDTQTSLLETPPPLPRPVVDFLEGFAARVAFGDDRTAAQQRQAKAAAEECAAIIARLKP